MNTTIIPSVSNETDRLVAVVLGIPDSMGGVPKLSEAYDAKSYETLELGIYPTEADVTYEMNALREVLEHHGVTVLRPSLVEDYNQVFARDVCFVIDDTLFVSNLIPDRSKETVAFDHILARIPSSHIEYLPEAVHTEGGDILLYNDILFVGCYLGADYPSYKMARTNRYAVDFFRERFSSKQIIPLELKKHDRDPRLGVLHLDCAFQPIGQGQALIYPEGFIHERDVHMLYELFGKDNLLSVTTEEAYCMNTNVVSLSPSRVISDSTFVRINEHLRSVWDIEVETVPYREVSKMGGLLRCSTMPLIRRPE